MKNLLLFFAVLCGACSQYEPLDVLDELPAYSTVRLELQEIRSCEHAIEWTIERLDAKYRVKVKQRTEENPGSCLSDDIRTGCFRSRTRTVWLPSLYPEQIDCKKADILLHEYGHAVQRFEFGIRSMRHRGDPDLKMAREVDAFLTGWLVHTLDGKFDGSEKYARLENHWHWENASHEAREYARDVISAAMEGWSEQ